jgi:hypothetical protein
LKACTIRFYSEATRKQSSTRGQRNAAAAAATAATAVAATAATAAATAAAAAASACCSVGNARIVTGEIQNSQQNSSFGRVFSLLGILKTSPSGKSLSFFPLKSPLYQINFLVCDIKSRVSENSIFQKNLNKWSSGREEDFYQCQVLSVYR